MQHGLVATLTCALVCGLLGGCSDDAADDPVYTGPPIYSRPTTPADDAGVGARAPWLIERGDAVFFVGNSFFDYDGRVLPSWVAAVGQSVSPAFPIVTGSHIVPGVNPLSWFFKQKASQSAIASGQYKLFILQGEETEPVADKAGFQDAVRAYHRAITAAGGKLMLFMTWDFYWYRNNPEFFRALSAAYEEIGAELGIPVIPVGVIWDDCNRAPFAGQRPYFLNSQDLHQNAMGSAVNAYATFSMLTGIDPQGVPFAASGNTSSRELLGYLSDKAWARVALRLP